MDKKNLLASLNKFLQKFDKIDTIKRKEGSGQKRNFEDT